MFKAEAFYPRGAATTHPQAPAVQSSTRPRLDAALPVRRCRRRRSSRGRGSERVACPGGPRARSLQARPTRPRRSSSVHERALVEQFDQPCLRHGVDAAQVDEAGDPIHHPFLFESAGSGDCMHPLANARGSEKRVDSCWKYELALSPTLQVPVKVRPLVNLYRLGRRRNWCGIRFLADRPICNVVAGR